MQANLRALRERSEVKPKGAVEVKPGPMFLVSYATDRFDGISTFYKCGIVRTVQIQVFGITLRDDIAGALRGNLPRQASSLCVTSPQGTLSITSGCISDEKDKNVPACTVHGMMAAAVGLVEMGAGVATTGGAAIALAPLLTAATSVADSMCFD